MAAHPPRHGKPCRYGKKPQGVAERLRVSTGEDMTAHSPRHGKPCRYGKQPQGVAERLRVPMGEDMAAHPPRHGKPGRYGKEPRGVAERLRVPTGGGPRVSFFMPSWDPAPHDPEPSRSIKPLANRPRGGCPRRPTPFSPPTGPPQTLFHWLPAKSKFLATKANS